MVTFGIYLFFNKPFLTVLGCFAKNSTPYICFLQIYRQMKLNAYIGLLG